MGVHVFPILNPLPPPSSSHSSGSSQCTSPEHPVSCIEPGLAICFTYDNIHVSVLFSQTIPPLPSPTESKRLFFTFVSLAVSHIGHCYHFSKFHIYQFSSVAQSCPTLCDPMNHSMPGLPVHHQFLEFTQTHVHLVNDGIQPSHPLLSPSPPAPIFPTIRVFSNESALCMRWPKYWSFSLNISTSNEHPGLISF